MMKNFTIILCTLFAFISTSNAQIADGSFELGTPNPSWDEASIAFGTPLCDQASCGTCGGPCVSRTGAWYAWFGGIGGAIETGSVDQDVVIPTGTTAELRMYALIAIPSGVANDRMEVSVDGNIEATIYDADSTTYASYTELVVDISSYADGGTHNVRIEGFQTTTTLVNILVDDVSLTVDSISIGLFEGGDIDKAAVMFPNPADNLVNLQFGDISSERVVISISSIDGKIVDESTLVNVAGRNFQFDTSTLNAGIYFVNVVQGNSRLFTDRLVVTGNQ